MANINENLEQSNSQNARIAKYLQEGNSITQLDALNLFGCLRLGARIADLKDRYNMHIITNMVTTSNGKRVASYKLVD